VPSFPRLIKPASVTPFRFPGPLIATGHSGKTQIRSTMQSGRQWTEVIKPFRAQSPEGRGLLTFIQRAWSRGIVFDIEHYLYQTKLGGATGAITINGANQTGETLNLAGVGGTDPVFRAGELLDLPGISQVFEVTADTNRGAGTTIAVPIFPPIFAGASPTNAASIVYGTGVRLNAKLAEEPQVPQAKSDEFIAGLTLVFVEDV
jgi:hypothetical protein